MNLPVQVGKYELQQLLGRGHYASVYAANDMLLDRTVALKLVILENPTDPQELISRLSEAVLQNRSQHRNVVQVHEVNLVPTPEGQAVGIAMDLVRGGSLQDRIAAKFLSAHDCILYFRDVIMGLEYLHTCHIIHRDIKPSNILLSQDRAKLSDFGLAGIVCVGQALSGEAYVTHKAPECFQMEYSYDVLTDIYALGMTLFRCVNNVRDWRDRLSRIPDVETKLQQGQIVERIGFEPYVPRELTKIVAKATAPDRSKRYQSVVDMQRSLNALRLSLDWHPLGDLLHWKAQGCSQKNKTDSYLLSISGTTVTLTRNGRRLGEYPKHYATPGAALAAAYEYIASTTID